MFVVVHCGVYPGALLVGGFCLCLHDIIVFFNVFMLLDVNGVSE